MDLAFDGTKWKEKKTHVKQYMRNMKRFDKNKESFAKFTSKSNLHEQY